MWSEKRLRLQTLAQNFVSLRPRETTLVESSEPRCGSETSVTLAQLGGIWTEIAAETETDRTVVGIQAWVGVDADRERDQDMPGQLVHGEEQMAKVHLYQSLKAGNCK